MSFRESIIRTGKAKADLVGKENHIVKLSGDEQEYQLAGAGEGFGTLDNDIVAEGDFCEITMIGGGAKVISGSALGIGAEITADANGKAVAAAAGNVVVGIAISAASAADEIIEMERVYYVKA